MFWHQTFFEGVCIFFYSLLSPSPLAFSRTILFQALFFYHFLAASSFSTVTLTDRVATAFATTPVIGQAFNIHEIPTRISFFHLACSTWGEMRTGLEWTRLTAYSLIFCLTKKNLANLSLLLWNISYLYLLNLFLLKFMFCSSTIFKIHIELGP